MEYNAYDQLDQKLSRFIKFVNNNTHWHQKLFLKKIFFSYSSTQDIHSSNIDTVISSYQLTSHCVTKCHLNISSNPFYIISTCLFCSKPWMLNAKSVQVGCPKTSHYQSNKNIFYFGNRNVIKEDASRNWRCIVISRYGMNN